MKPSSIDIGMDVEKLDPLIEKVKGGWKVKDFKPNRWNNAEPEQKKL